MIDDRSFRLAELSDEIRRPLVHRRHRGVARGNGVSRIARDADKLTIQSSGTLGDPAESGDANGGGRAVRMLLRIRIDTEAGNAAVPNGTVERAFKEFADRANPEAAYFFADRGKRAALFVFDQEESSQTPVLLEPLFQQLRAEVQLTPVMNFDDLQKGLSAVGRRPARRTSRRA